MWRDWRKHLRVYVSPSDVNPCRSHLNFVSKTAYTRLNMSKVSQPELKRFLDKNILINMQGGRKIKGNLRGYDLFLNLVVDEAVEQVQAENNQHLWVDGARCGTVVCTMYSLVFFWLTQDKVIRGNSVNSLEGLESINTK